MIRCPRISGCDVNQGREAPLVPWYLGPVRPHRSDHPAWLSRPAAWTATSCKGRQAGRHAGGAFSSDDSLLPHHSRHLLQNHSQPIGGDDLLRIFPLAFAPCHLFPLCSSPQTKQREIRASETQRERDKREKLEGIRVVDCAFATLVAFTHALVKSVFPLPRFWFVVATATVAGGSELSIGSIHW